MNIGISRAEGVIRNDDNIDAGDLPAPFASLLIDNRDEHPEAGSSGSKALTMKGHCYPLENSDHTAGIRSRFLRRHPNLTEFAAHSDAELICIRISSVLFLDGLTEAYFEEYR